MPARTQKIIAILIVFLASYFFTGTNSVYSQTPLPTPTSNSETKEKALQDKVKEYEGKINDLQGQAKTLSSQLSLMDNQMKLTEYKVNATKQELIELENDIGVAEGKVDKLERALDGITTVLMNRVVKAYQVGNIAEMQILLAADNMSSYLTRTNYLRLVQAHDKRLLINTQQAKVDYENQKNIFEAKKQKVESLQKQLREFTLQLEEQKKEKQNLLDATKNSESEYHKRLNDALKELQTIQKAAQVLISTEPRRVIKGERIGLMGNSGYSFGSHLHFGIYNITSLAQYSHYANFENPGNFLETKNVKWDTGCSGDPTGSSSTGSGSFAWPMSSDNLTITQASGQTCYSNVYYRGKPHPAFDMYNRSDIVVRAVEEGQAYFCRNCTGDGGNGVFIFHPNGKMSLYWHLQ